MEAARVGERRAEAHGHLHECDVEVGRSEREPGAQAPFLREPHSFLPFQRRQAVKENCRDGEIMRKALCFSPSSELLAHHTLEMRAANGCACFIAYLWESI